MQGKEGGWQDVFFAGGGFLSEGGIGQRGIFAGGGFVQRVFLPEGGFVRKGVLYSSRTDDIDSGPAAWSYIPVQSSSCSLRVFIGP